MASCVRTAWLALGSSTLLLEDGTKGYFCSELNLGYPATREVVNDRPDQDGVVDRTQYMGSRVVSANISALAGAGAQIDAVASSFAPYMVASARPVLHYVLDRPGAAERTMTLRASGYSWPIVGPSQRDIQLQWIAADPIARDPNVSSATSWAGMAFAGRTYALIFNRIYPPGTSAPSSGVIVSNGDVPVRPMVRIYGPISAPSLQFGFSAGGYSYIRFIQSFHIDAGHYVDVDTRAKTAWLDGDHTQSVLAQIDWANTTWASLPVAPANTVMNLSGSGTSGVTQAVATWQDGYLT